jgi:chemotaxis protein methyltransferase CheR
LSAPCSNGSEPYTLAIILKEMGISPTKFKIYATDLDHTILDKARRAEYKENSLKNVSDKILEKYFKESSDGKTYVLSSEIKRLVNFEQTDLINARFKNDWDLILSRNFFIYLTKDMKDQLINKFTSVLNPGGYFFLGNTEYIFSPEKYGLDKIFQSFYKYEG